MSKAGITWQRCSYLLRGADNYLTLRWRKEARQRLLDIQTVDLIIQNTITASDNPVHGAEDEGHAVFEFIDRAIQDVEKHSTIGIKLILPACDGHVSRSDMIDFRMIGCELVSSVSSFVVSRQHLHAVQPHKSEDILGIIGSTVCAILVKSAPDCSIELTLAKLELELLNRMSIKWLLPDPIPYRRIAIVRCQEENISYETIRAMGIGLIVLDEPGNYLEDPQGPSAYLREAFIPIDLNPDLGLSRRIVDALKDYHVDGIFTRLDIHHTSVAEACVMLGLPTSPPSAFACATDKYATRMNDAESCSAICVTSVEDLEQRLHSAISPLQLNYPVVVKPCSGVKSWCVLKADSEVELLAAVRKAHSRVIGHENGKSMHSPTMIEPYVDGPEFDINYAMWNGEILFTDVSDNFPCAGDMDTTTGFLEKDFQETLFVYPTLLPVSEQALLVNTLHQKLLNMGFRSGVFHVEARVRNSTTHYAHDNGTFDLMPKSDPTSFKPSIFMIEVNARPAGYYGLQAVTWTFGVDYLALHVLRCIGDETRFRAFANPFQDGPQYSSALVLIMPEKGGILMSPDPAQELRLQRPDLMDMIAMYHNTWEKGQQVIPPDAVDMMFLTFMIVNSRIGRKDLLAKQEEIRRNWRAVIE